MTEQELREYATKLAAKRSPEETNTQIAKSAILSVVEPSPPSVCGMCSQEGKVLESGLCWDCEEKAKLESDRQRWMKKRTEENLKLLEKQIGESYFKEFSFETITQTPQNRNLLAFLRAFNPLSDNCYIWGRNGSGKTHFGVSTLKAAVASGNYIAEFWRPMSLHRHFLGLQTNPAKYDSELERLGRLDLLMFDEFGLGKDSEKSLEIAFELIDYRLRNGKNGNIFCTNLKPQDSADKFGDNRIMDRIMELCPEGSIFELTEPVSWRVKNRGKA